MTTPSEVVEKMMKEFRQAFDHELVEMNMARDMHNRPPLYDVDVDSVEEIRNWSKSHLLSTSLALIESIEGMIEGLRLKNEDVTEVEFSRYRRLFYNQALTDMYSLLQAEKEKIIKIKELLK